MKLSLTSLRTMFMRSKLTLICSGILMMSIGVYFWLCKPQELAAEGLHSRLQQQRIVLQNTQRELQNMPDQTAYYRQLQEEEVWIKTLLPDSDAISELLIAVNTLSKEHSLKISNIKQGAFVDHKTYYEIPWELTVTGTYPDSVRFIKKLENLPRFNSISRIGVQGEENIVIMQLAVTVYVYGPMPHNVQAKAK